jgi:hypothetical protein
MLAGDAAMHFIRRRRRGLPALLGAGPAAAAGSGVTRGSRPRKRLSIRVLRAPSLPKARLRRGAAGICSSRLESACRLPELGIAGLHERPTFEMHSDIGVPLRSPQRDTGSDSVARCLVRRWTKACAARTGRMECPRATHKVEADRGSLANRDRESGGLRTRRGRLFRRLNPGVVPLPWVQPVSRRSAAIDEHQL